MLAALRNKKNLIVFVLSCLLPLSSLLTGFAAEWQHGMPHQVGDGHHHTACHHAGNSSSCCLMTSTELVIVLPALYQVSQLDHTQEKPIYLSRPEKPPRIFS